MNEALSLKLQSVIDELKSILDNKEKLRTSEEVEREFELYDEGLAKSSFLEFSLDENLYAILNAKEEHFYTVERTYTQGKNIETEFNDEKMNELLSEIFKNGDYIINTSYRVNDGGGSVLDPYSADYHYEYGEVRGVPLTTVGYKSKSDIEYDKTMQTVEKAKAVLRELKENNEVLVSDKKETTTAPRNFEEAVKKIYPKGTYKLSFSLLDDISNDIKVVLNPNDNTYSVSTYSFGEFKKGIDDPEINEILEQIFTNGKYTISTFSQKANHKNAYKVIKGKAFDRISHKAIRPVLAKEQSDREVSISEIGEVARGETITSKNGAINAVTSQEEEKIQEGQSHDDE